MVAPSVLPGRAFQATTPNSNLLFYWRAQSRDIVTVDRLSTGTLTRASAGGLTDGRGQVTANALTDVRLVGAAADNQPRWGVSTATVPHLLLEDTRTNLFPISKPTTGWQTSNAVSTGGETTVAPDGTLVALLIDRSTAATRSMVQDVEVASTIALTTWYTKWNGSTFGAIHQLGLVGVAARGRVIWEFGSTGTMTITSTAAGNVISAPSHIGNNWWKTSLECTGISTGQDNQVQIFPAVTADGTTGSMFISEIQVEDVASTGLFASSHIPTVSAAVTRANEQLFFTFLPAPQAMTFYGKVQDWVGGLFSATLFHLGTASAGATPNLTLSVTSGGGIQMVYNNGVTSVNTGTVTAPNDGEDVEYLVTLTADGVIDLAVSINGGGLTNVAASAANALPTAWAGTRLYINSAGTTQIGFGKHENLKVAAGVQTIQPMRESF